MVPEVPVDPHPIFYQNSPLIIIVRGTHGKQPSGWMLPRNGPREVTHQMAKKIEQRLDIIIDTVLYRRLPEVPGIAAEGWASVSEVAAKFRRR